MNQSEPLCNSTVGSGAQNFEICLDKIVQLENI